MWDILKEQFSNIDNTAGPKSLRQQFQSETYDPHASISDFRAKLKSYQSQLASTAYAISDDIINQQLTAALPCYYKNIVLILTNVKDQTFISTLKQLVRQEERLQEWKHNSKTLYAGKHRANSGSQRPFVQLNRPSPSNQFNQHYSNRIGPIEAIKATLDPIKTTRDLINRTFNTNSADKSCWYSQNQVILRLLVTFESEQKNYDIREQQHREGLFTLINGMNHIQQTKIDYPTFQYQQQVYLQELRFNPPPLLMTKAHGTAILELQIT